MKTNEWFHVAPMNTRRSSVGVGVVGGKLTNDIKKNGGGNAIFFFLAFENILQICIFAQPCNANGTNNR